MRFIETSPFATADMTSNELLFCGKADIQDDATLSERWLLISKDEIFICTSSGKLVRHVLVSAVNNCRTSDSIGGSQLIADTENGAVVLVRYTSMQNAKFAYACRLLQALIKEEELPIPSADDLPKRCSKCGVQLINHYANCPRCTDKVKAFKRVLEYAKPFKKWVGITSLLVIVTTIIELIPPYLTKIIVDDVLQPTHPAASLLAFVLMLGLVQLTLSAMTTIRGYIGVHTGSKLMHNIREDVYRSLMRLSLGYFDRRQTSQFIGRVNHDAEALNQFLNEGIIWVSSQVLLIISIFMMMGSLDWQLTLLALLPAPIIMFFSFVIWPITHQRWYMHSRALYHVNTIVGDTLQGIRVVKAFGQEKKERGRYSEANDALMRQTIRVNSLWAGISPFFLLIFQSGLLLVWYVGGQSVLGQEMTLGTLMAFIGYMGMFFGPLRWFSQAVNWTSRAFAAAGRIFEIIDTKPEVPDHEQALALPYVYGEVKFENVSYGYEKHRPVLKEISFTVQPGEMIGIVGHSGAGKSTLIHLLCRFYDPDNGTIRIDGTDIKDMKQDSLRQHIGVVLQETFLFDGSVAQNIAYAKPDATPAEIMRAAKIANAHDFIIRMPDGYDTRVGERGTRLSGGERQRIAIARAILHDPAILILDEATASVDTATERQIQEAMMRLICGRTTFAIAHRLSTLRHANRIIVLDQGKLVEAGSHEQLLAQNGVYAKLVQAQQEMSEMKGEYLFA
ncbi:ABC transporter ATP-binding protein [Paenibacillus sp.]|uniref:ABC transporter ATP-binding protein n=1 Tax=Paenibacillus sp. TaxID=58172 RepID=UPI003463FFBF